MKSTSARDVQDPTAETPPKYASASTLSRATNTLLPRISGRVVLITTLMKGKTLITAPISTRFTFSSTGYLSHPRELIGTTSGTNTPTPVNTLARALVRRIFVLLPS